MEEDKNLTNNNNIQSTNEQKSNINITLIIIIIMLLIFLGIAGYFLFINKGDSGKESQKQDTKININYDILNYHCKKEYCDVEDYDFVKELLKTSDRVRTIFDGGNDRKTHVVLLENASTGNVYLYSVDNDKYYFKNDNYYHIDIVTGGYESGGIYVWDNNYVIVHQKITKHYENDDVETANSKIYSLKDEKYVFESDENYDCSYAEYQNKRFYKLTNNGDSALYDDKFNKVFEKDTWNYAFDNKYIYGKTEENSKYRFFRYDIATKKYELSNVMFDDLDDWEVDCTYNYIVKGNGNEFEIYDFDGNIIFKTDEKSNLKNIKTKDYVMPFLPKVYYSKAENKIKLIIEPDICGDESCPPHFGYSYYEYDIESKKVSYKFYTDNIPDNIYQNLSDGYAEF